MKFSTADFLGEPIQASSELFDVTPSQYVTQYMTEIGPFEPGEVQERIRVLLKGVYP
jgi:translation initiation factor 2B subunit (eIF-2B alpha/beta/delta family)